jgi:hypothetical protein
MNKSLYFDSSIANSLNIYSDESFVLPSYLKNSSFNSLPLEYMLDATDESFDSYKSSLSQQSRSNKTQMLALSNSLNSLSYSYVVDPFRADYEDQL